MTCYQMLQLGLFHLNNIRGWVGKKVLLWAEGHPQS